MRYDKSCETIQDRGADLDLRNLSIEVARREALTEEFHTMHPIVGEMISQIIF